jgi:protein-S-isoprenylcysteine O-methyltransferase Ste14
MNKLVILSLIYGLSEAFLMMIKHSRSTDFSVRNDKGSAALLWLAITIGFAAGFMCSRPAGDLRMLFGLAIIICGVIIRWVAIIQLGESFTVDVAIKNQAVLKTDGIYKKVRHPSYLGLIIIVLGFCFSMNSIISLLVFSIPVIIALFYRMGVEEKVLVNEFGESYISYRNSTKKLIPGII